MSAWSDPVDLYCERLDASFWAEPLNAVSNAAFLIAAGAALLRWRHAGASDLPVLLLIVVVAVVGIGSFLFHTLANRWSELADVLPIAVFIYGYFLLAMRRFLGLGAPAAIALTLLFAGFSFGFVRLWLLAFGPRGVEITNGSVGYFPAALALLGVGGLLVAAGRSADGAGAPAVATFGARAQAGRSLLRAALLFVVSLLFRSVDLALCGSWPLGTHFVWHVLNAALLFRLVDAALSYRAATNRSADPPRLAR